MEGVTVLAITPLLLFPTQRPFLTLAALMWLILLWSGGLFYRPFLPAPSPLNRALLIWLVALAVGILVSADPDLTLPKASGVILGLAVWHFFAWGDNGRWRLCLFFFILSGVGFVGLGVLSTQWLGKIPGLAPWLGWLPASLIQLPESGGAVHANQLAGTLLLYGPFTFAWALPWGQNRWLRVGAAFLAVLLGGLLLLTQSRSGWMGGGTAVLFLLVSYFWPVKNAKWLAVGLVGLLLGGLFLGVWFGRTLQAPIDSTSTLTAWQFRVQIWQTAVTALQNAPLTGVGLGTFRRVARRLFPLGVPARYDIAHAHNIFLQMALDTGLPGLVAYLALLGVAGRMGWQLKSHRPLVIGLCASLIAFHVYGLTDALALGSKTAVGFWFILALLNTLYREQSA